MTRFSRGCHREDGSHKRTPFSVARMRGLVSAALPASVDLSQFAPAIVDQSVYSACEGCAGSTAIYVTLAKAGAALPWVPSQSEIYRLARAIDRADPSIPLLDEGTYTNAVERAISEFGVRPMGAVGAGTNCDLGHNINAEPLLGDLEQDAQTLLLGTYQITSTGSAKLADVKIALASGFAVRVDSDVDSAFEDWTPSMPPIGAPDPGGILGGHALVATGYHGDTVIVTNSWGSSWGESGRCLVSPAWIEQADCYAWAVKRA